MKNNMYGDNRPAPYQSTDRDEEQRARRRSAARGDSRVPHPYMLPDNLEAVASIPEKNRRERRLRNLYPEGNDSLRELPQDEWRNIITRALSRSEFPSAGIMLGQRHTDQGNTGISMPGGPRNRTGTRGFFATGRNFSSNPYAQTMREFDLPNARNTMISSPPALGHEMFHRLQHMDGLHADGQLVEDINSVIARRGGRIEGRFGREIIPWLIAPVASHEYPDFIFDELSQEGSRFEGLQEDDRLRVVQAVEDYLVRVINRRSRGDTYERSDRTLPGGRGGRGRPTYE